MAKSKPIKYSQIAEPKLFDPLKKEIEEVNSLLKLTEDNLKTIISESAKIAKSTPLDSYKNLSKVEKGIKDTTEAVQELDKIEKDRAKLEARKKQLENDSIKRNFELKEEIRLQTKELRDNAKAAKASGNAYEVLKKSTNEAQLEAKRLAAEFGANSKQAEGAVKEFERLDDQLRAVNERMRDGRRDVGRYELGTRRLTGAFKAFASATIVLKVFELLGTSIQNNSEGAAEFEKVMVRLTTFIEVFGRRFVEILPIITAKFDQLILSFKIGLAELKGLFGSNSDELSKLKKEYEEVSKIADKDLAGAFKGLGEEIEDLTAKKIKLIDDTIAYRREIIGVQRDIAKLIPTQEKLRAQFENDRNSLEEQIEAGLLFRESLQKTQSLEEQIALKKLQLAEQNAKANSVNLEAQEALAEATLAYNQLVADQAAELIGVEKEIQRARDDSTQLNLDFYIDDFDNRKTINERIIADETQTFEKRRQLLKENQRFTEETFRLEEEALNKSLEERGKATLNYDELVSNSAEQNAKIVRESGISEDLAIRVLEVIRERRMFLQDNAEAQRDLNKAEDESRLIQSDIILQREALNKLDKEGVDLNLVLESLANKRVQNEIDNLRLRLALAKDGSAEFLAVNQELNEKLLEQDQQRLNKEKDLQAKRIESVKEGVELLNDLFQQRSEKRIESIDKELEAENSRAERLQELAEQGNEDAQRNLAITEKRQAELELQRQQQLERQQRSELALSAIQSYSEKVQAGDPNPLASTISDISVLRAFINSLPSFYEGTEDTGKVTNPLDSKGGRLTVLHDNERVIDKANNKLIGQMSNRELAQLASKERIKAKEFQSFEPLINEVKNLTKITQNKPVYLGTDYDNLADAIISKVKKGSTLEKTHKRNGGIWG